MKIQWKDEDGVSTAAHGQATLLAFPLHGEVWTDGQVPDGQVNGHGIEDVKQRLEALFADEAQDVDEVERAEVISALKGELAFCREMAEGLNNTPAAKSTMLYRARGLEKQIAQLEGGR